MIPLVGPTGYVLLFSPTAEMVKEVGVASTYVRFHWNVMGLDGAILKKDVEDWGG